jgi:hypothetical protein
VRRLFAEANGIQILQNENAGIRLWKGDIQ